MAAVDHEKRVRFLHVKVGKDFCKELEITEGLVGNERLFANPSDELVKGMTVRTKSEQR